MKSSPNYYEEKDIAIAYYHIDEHNKIWIRSPLRHDFVVEEPHTGDDRFSARKDGLFKIPFLKKMGVTLRTHDDVLITCLWLKDHKSYSDHLVKTGTEFYRCLTKGFEDNWILIPLYAKIGYKSVKNPVMLYRELGFKNTLIIKNKDIHDKLVSAFFDFKYKGYINHFSVLINGKMRWMVQFPNAPACFL